jgi:formate dehydrogenase alpha subunit
VAGLVTTFGAGAMTNSINEIRDADFLFVIGSNTTEAHPIIAMEMKRAVARGARIVVADPRNIWLNRIAIRHMQLKPGSDVWLLNAMAHVIIKEGLCDDKYIEENTEHFEQVKASVADYTPEEAEHFTGIPAQDIIDTAREYATTRKAGIYYTLGITEHSHGTDNVYGLSNLVLMTGHLGIASSGMNPLRGQNNVQGANDSGATPVFYPGYQRFDAEGVKEKYEEAWGCEMPEEEGMNLNVMMAELGTTIKGLFIMGEDIVISEPNTTHVEWGMNNVDFVIAQEIFFNETTRYADVIFPAACFAEKDGVFTNSERRVQRVRKAVNPPGKARADWEILVDFANACGADWSYKNTEEIYDEFVKDAPNFAGLTYAKIAEEGMQWPCVDEDDMGTKFLHEEGILRGKGQFMPISYRPPLEVSDDEYPLILATGRVLYHYNSATQTRRADGLHEKEPENFLQMHPRDARKRQIKEGQSVMVSSRRGKVGAKARITRDVRPGSVWMPFHFAEAKANEVTNDQGDPITGTAEFKVCAVQVK